MDKQELRQKYKGLREKLSADEIDEMSLQIANQSLNLEIWDYEYYHLFLSITEKKEIHTEYLLQIIFGKDKNAVIPKVNQTELDHYLLTDTTKLKISDWGIPEPESGIKINPKQLDVIFLPLLAVDKFGNRIGYGKGFYDKFLSECHPDVIKIGVSLFEPEETEITSSSHDVALDYCLTPSGSYKF